MKKGKLIDHAEMEVPQHNPEDDYYTYNRVYSEEIVYLNKSNSKWFSFGVKPRMRGVFSPIIRLFDNRGFYMTFSKKQFPIFFKLVKRVVKNQRDCNFASDNEEGFIPDKNLYIVKSEYYDKVFTIFNSSSEKAEKMMIGLNTLQRILELEKMLFEKIESIDCEGYKKVFDDLISDCSFKKKDPQYDEKVKKYLFSRSKTHLQNENNDLESKVSQETLMHFDDFFLNYLKQNGELNNE